MNPNFESEEQLHALMNEQQKGSLTIGQWHLEGYPGMAFELGIIFDVRTRQKKYQLDVLWTNYGLDLYGESFMQNYVYQFNKPEKLLAYLEKVYQIRLTDIPVKYSFDSKKFPNPIHNADQEAIFQDSWDRFSVEFEAGNLLDREQKLVYFTEGKAYFPNR